MKKKKYLLLLILGLLIFQVQAQVTIGVKGGYTNTWKDYEFVGFYEDVELDINGFNISLIAQYQLMEKFSLELEPGFVRRGGVCTPDWNLYPSPIIRDNDWHLNYVELPLMVAYSQPIIPNSLEITGKIGGGAAFLIKAREIRHSNWQEPITTISTITNTLNHWDYGLYAGLGLKKHLGAHQVILDADFYRGLTDVDENFASKNRSIDFSLGYLYSL